MKEKPIDPMTMFKPYVPMRQMWLLFKVGSLEHMTDLQRGLLYMNSLAYFSNLDGESCDELRADPAESMMARVYGGSDGQHIYKFTLRIPEEDGDKTVDISDNARLTLEVPNPANAMIFCLCALADDEDGKIPGETDGELWLDRRLLQFGTHLLLIHNAKEFSARISAGIHANPHLYNSKYFQGGYGLVEYMDLTKRALNIGLFRKDLKYSWQREFRLILGARDAGLNPYGALELQVGDLSDITQLIELKNFLKSPLKIGRHLVRKVGDKYEEVVPD